MAAATRKSAKRTAGKKRSSAKRASAKKRAGGKASSPRRTTGRIKKAGKTAGKVAGKVKKKARKVARAARGPINTVMDAGGKTWEALKSTTANMMEGMKGSFGGDERGAR
jgi:hypothetical protein